MTNDKTILVIVSLKLVFFILISVSSFAKAGIKLDHIHTETSLDMISHLYYQLEELSLFSTSCFPVAKTQEDHLAIF